MHGLRSFDSTQQVLPAVTVTAQSSSKYLEIACSPCNLSVLFAGNADSSPTLPAIMCLPRAPRTFVNL